MAAEAVQAHVTAVNPSPSPTREPSTYSYGSAVTESLTTTWMPPSKGATGTFTPLIIHDLDRPWYHQPVVNLLAWCLLIYCLISFYALMCLIMKGALDWRLNLAPNAFISDDDTRDLSWMNDNSRNTERFRHREYEPRPVSTDEWEDADDQHREVEWWEAMEMQPHRGTPPITANEPRAHAWIYDSEDRVEARIPMPHPRDEYRDYVLRSLA